MNQSNDKPIAPKKNYWAVRKPPSNLNTSFLFLFSSLEYCKNNDDAATNKTCVNSADNSVRDSTFKPSCIFININLTYFQ
jgi:hypothetical protein